MWIGAKLRRGTVETANETEEPEHLSVRTCRLVLGRVFLQDGRSLDTPGGFNLFLDVASEAKVANCLLRVITRPATRGYW
jgi:hypothetical protein